MSLLLTRSFCHFSIDQIKDARNGFAKSKVLGIGGEGKVYLTKVCIEGKNTLVAVKRLHPDSNGLEKEIQTVPKIQHPHIVPLFGYCNQSGQNILVYKFMKNGSLSDYVRDKRRVCLSWPQRLKICVHVARGLQHLHTPTEEFPKGIIHRDIKPENILLDENLVAKISDFGLSKLSHSGQTKSSMATDRKGTIGYYAPEYLEFSHVTRRIDVYAFGVVLFQVLCRKMPWDRDGESYYRKDDEDLGLWAQKKIDIEIKREISPDSLNTFTDIINRCLRRNPDERPSMDDVVLDLEKALKFQDPGMNVLVLNQHEVPKYQELDLDEEPNCQDPTKGSFVLDLDGVPIQDPKGCLELDLDDVPKYQEHQPDEAKQPLNTELLELDARRSVREREERRGERHLGPVCPTSRGVTSDILLPPFTIVPISGNGVTLLTYYLAFTAILVTVMVSSCICCHSVRLSEAVKTRKRAGVKGLYSGRFGVFYFDFHNISLHSKASKSLAFSFFF